MSVYEKVLSATGKPNLQIVYMAQVLDQQAKEIEELKNRNKPHVYKPKFYRPPDDAS